MEIQLFAIRDTKSEGFGRPFAFTNATMAIRSFTHAIGGADQAMSEYPDDFTLYKIGDYNDDSGLIAGHDPIRIITGLEAIRNDRVRKDKLESLHAEIKDLNGENHAQQH